ncbi:uncharacterized protein LOC132064994 [Lycium ferocissimum]|uniref:uncharacterized protein LOC132064994 n=1 Tax=Lycium ferocissimum TaxID=112874 RepID=UPI0028163782|nr:uncharacterized protein LOC132064994 [Lycium ferocissimum]
MHHIFIDFELDEDHRNVYGSEENPICGMQMRLQKWTTDFKLDKETSLAMVWITLPEFPWHYFEWDALRRIVDPIGALIITDKATLSKTRPTTAKVKVEIDLTRPLRHEVMIKTNDSTGKEVIIPQRIKYETIPEYCNHCKIQGHCENKCRILHPELRKNVKMLITVVNSGKSEDKGNNKDSTSLNTMQGDDNSDALIINTVNSHTNNMKNGKSEGD